MIKSRRNFMILLLVMVLTLAGAALAFENEPEGFRGLKWGDPPGEEMIKYLSLPPVNYYKLPDEPLSLGNVDLYLVGYQFLVSPEGEVLMGVGLYFRGERNYDLMKIICKERFGPGGEEWWLITWWSPETFIILKYDMIKERGRLGICSVPLLREMTEATEEIQSEKAKRDW